MPANFTSGWLGHGEAAWHGEGHVTPGTLPPREAFEVADALFTVEKRHLFFPTFVPETTERDDWQASGSYAVVRTDTQKLLGIVSEQYELVQNDALLTMAEFIREEVDMDAVVVLGNGKKVCFTANLRGASSDIVPGDTVKRRIIGYLGHDGQTGCGAKFTNIRVVCQNTLTAALNDSGEHRSITHKQGANGDFQSLIQSIDTARQDFVVECDLMREFSRFTFGPTDFHDFVDEVYNIDPGTMFRKRDKLEAALPMPAMAGNLPLCSLWSAVNAVTQVETSTKGDFGVAKRASQFARGTFGAGASISKKAFEVAANILVA